MARKPAIGGKDFGSGIGVQTDGTQARGCLGASAGSNPELNQPPFFLSEAFMTTFPRVEPTQTASSAREPAEGLLDDLCVLFLFVFGLF